MSMCQWYMSTQASFMLSLNNLIVIDSIFLMSCECFCLCQELEKSLNEFGMPWMLNPGDGAFYGPKVGGQLYNHVVHANVCLGLSLCMSQVAHQARPCLSLVLKHEVTWSISPPPTLDGLLVHRMFLPSALNSPVFIYTPR